MRPAVAPLAFPVKYPLTSGVYLAQWNAIRHLGSVFGTRLPAASELRLDVYADAVWRIQRLWRVRVRKLRSAGWQLPRAYQQFYDCPSAFARLRSPRRTCLLSHLCPHCWCRLVVADTYYRVHGSLYAVGRRHALPHSLVGIRCFEVVPVNVLADQTLARILYQARDRQQQHRRVLRGLSHGLLSLTTISPAGPEAVEIQYRYLAQTSRRLDRQAALDDSFFEGARPMFCYENYPVSTTQLSDLVSWVCRYPVDLLCGDAQLAAQILEARTGARGTTLRFRECLGIFRNSQLKRVVHEHCGYRGRRGRFTARSVAAAY